jgi:TolA-binding protein
MAAAPLCGLALAGCVYFNTFYNAKKYYGEGEKLAARAPANAGLPAPARTAFEKAVEKSSQVLTSHPNSKYADDALLLLGKAHFRLGNYSESAGALQGLLESHPQSGLRREAAIWLVRAGRESGDAATAERVAGELLAEGDLSASDRVALQLERAKLAMQAGDHAAAVAIYEDLERSDADRARRERVGLLRAEARLAQGDTAAALVDLRPLVGSDEDPDLQREASVVLASILASSGEPGRAIETYREVLAGGVGDSVAAEIHLALAETQLSEGDFQEASEELGTAARLVPSSRLAATALYHRGLIEWRDLRSRDVAKKTFLEAFLQDPQGPAADSAASAARTIQEVQHYQAILAGSEQVLSPLTPEEVKATATYLLAELLYTRESDEEGARKLFTEMLTLYPRSAWTPKVLYTLGWLAEHEGRAEGDSSVAGPLPAGELSEPAASLFLRLIEEYPRTEYAQYAREALADAAGARPTMASDSPVAPAADGGLAPGDSSTDRAAGPAATPADGGETAAADEGLLALPDQAQVVEVPPGARAPGADVVTAVAPAPGHPGVAPDSAASPTPAEQPTELVDERLKAYTLALPRPQDPLIGIEDRLLARQRGEASDEGPGRRPGRGAAPEAGSLPLAAADSLTTQQIDSIAREGGVSPGDGQGPAAATPGGPPGSGGGPEDRK